MHLQGGRGDPGSERVAERTRGVQALQVRYHQSEPSGSDHCAHHRQAGPGDQFQAVGVFGRRGRAR